MGRTLPEVESSAARTGAGGRAEFAAAAQAADPGVRSVILVDLDQFRTINVTYGHENGDLVLLSVARRLAAATAGKYLLAQLSGDEFAVVVPSADRTLCETIAGHLYDAIRQPVALGGGRKLYLDAGIGIALGDGELPLWELVSRAGASIEPLKRTGRLPRIVVFDEATHGEILDRLKLSIDLRAALTRGELLLHYQPIVDMASRQAAGFEALVRWSHPIRGLIPPLLFVPLAEAAGLMPELGEWIMENACNQARAWADQLELPPYVSVNISIRQLEDPDFTQRFRAALERSQLEPDRLKIEVTESVLAEGLEEIGPRLEAVRSLGVGVLLDDFGTGYSSLGYIRDLPLDGVKLDRFFTRDLTVSAGAWTLARSIVALLHNLDLEIIAEGLETAADLAQLRSLGCNIGQGYYFARPESAASLQFEGLGRSVT